MSDFEQEAVDDAENNLILRDEHGDTVQDIGTRLIEKDSYERVRDGLAIAAEACAHLERREPEHADMWRRLRLNFDQVRRAAIQQAGLEDNIRSKETREVTSNVMAWRLARDRLYDALKQVEGGMRQLGVCHRGDIIFAQMANDIEKLAIKIKNRNQARLTAMRQRGLLWMPGDP